MKGGVCRVCFVVVWVLCMYTYMVGGVHNKFQIYSVIIASCLCRPLFALLSYIAVLFCRFHALMFLFTALCLTHVNFFVLLYGNVIPRVLI
jgi:hypothetical protein